MHVPAAFRVTALPDTVHTLGVSEENETGINCIAFPLFLDHPSQPTGAVSVSALVHRMGIAEIEAAAGELRTLVESALGAVTR